MTNEEVLEMNPYVIGPYKEGDSYKFKGRASEIRCMYESFLQNDYLVCYADSGEGKSSILNAGLFPKMRENRYFPINVRFLFDEAGASETDFDRIVGEALDEALKKAGENWTFVDGLMWESVDAEDEKWQRDLIGSRMWLKLRYGHIEKTDAVGGKVAYVPVLVFDQFEEVFTNPKSELWTRNFFKWLEELSTDVCPQDIWVSLLVRKGTEAPAVASGKKFKAVFSLRSEYVGMVDYWGLQYCYVPDLKNNRFLLKPLTADGAREVVFQPGPLQSISEDECHAVISGCCQNGEYLDAGLPCVPASVLSIVCSRLAEMDAADRGDLLKRLNCKAADVVEEILEKYYLSILEACGISDAKARDAFENAMVDDKGNRKRVGVHHESLSMFSDVQLRQLEERNLLRVVSRSDRSVGAIVELPHDRFCKFIMNHKNRRFKELQEKIGRQKEQMLFGALCFVFLVISVCFHNGLLPDMSGVIGACLENKCSDLFAWFSDFVLGKSAVEAAAVADLTSGFVAVLTLLSSLFVPVVIVGVVKRLRKTTVLLSCAGLLMSCLVLWRTEFTLGLFSWILAGMSIAVSLAALIGSFFWKNDDSRRLSDWPLWGSLFLFSGYLFWETVHSLAVGMPEPSDSSIFIVLLPVLLLLWSRAFFRKEKDRTHIVVRVLCLSGYAALLLVLALNNVLPYSSAYKLGLQAVEAILGVSFLLFAASVWDIERPADRTVALLLNCMAVIFSVVYSLGYNPMRVSWKDVHQVANWRSVVVKDEGTGKYGVLNPYGGDTLMPCVCDKFCPGGAIVSSNSDLISKIPLASMPESFLNSSPGNAFVGFFWSPLLDEKINRWSGNSEKDKVEHCSLRVFFSLRNACMKYVAEARPIELDDIKHLPELDSMLESVFDAEVKKLSMYESDEGWTFAKLRDSDLTEFYKVVTRRMLLSYVKGRIAERDYPALLGASYLALCVLVPSAVEQSGNISLNSCDEIKGKKVFDTITLNDLNDGKCYAWPQEFFVVAAMDAAVNMEKLQDAVSAYGTVMSRHATELARMRDLLVENVIKNGTARDLLEFVESLEVARRAVRESAGRMLHDMDSLHDISCRKWDGADSAFMHRVCDLMYERLVYSPRNIYNNSFKNIYEYMVIVGGCRLYDMSAELKRMDEIDSLDMFGKSKETLKLWAQFLNQSGEFRSQLEQIYRLTF